MEQQGSQSRGGQSSSGTTSGIQSGMQSVADDAQEKIEQAVDQVRERGKSQLASQKDRVAGTVESVAHALRETGKQLKQSNDAPVADYVDHVADSVEQLSNHLRQRNVDELIGETESFARRQPVLFLGGAFFLGLVAARFLKSSRLEQSGAANGYGSIPGTPRGAATTAPFSWQTGPHQPSQPQLPASTRPPSEGQRMGSGSSSTPPPPRGSG